MKIDIATQQLDLTPSFKTYIEGKLGNLAKYIKRFDEMGAAEARFDIARETRHHQKGDVFRATVDLRLPKRVLRAEAEAESAHAAVDEIERKLKMEIEKYKTRFVKPKRESPRR